jgi:hypothetical protein
MSARLKLKKLKKEMEFVQQRCRIRENEAEFLKHKCLKLLQENIIEISSFAELYPCEMMSSAEDCLDYNVHKITDSIVRKYAEQLAEYVRNQLMTKYALNKFSTFGVRLLAPSLNEEHIKVEIKEEYK